MWRQVQMGRSDPPAWDRNAANRCATCGEKSPAGDFVWVWGDGRRVPTAPDRTYCLRCGPPSGEKRGADVAAAIRRSAGDGPPKTQTGAAS